jgi:hypothetical protein
MASSATLAIRVERARICKMPIAILTMVGARNPVVWLMGIMAFTAIFFLLRSHFGNEARDRRRREKSHRRVISRKRGPTVKLAVDVDKPKREHRR